MAATATVQEINGASAGTPTDITAARFCTTDAYAPTTTYPIPIPTGAANNSYWKTWRLKFTGTYTSITNVKIYTDAGGFGTGITVYVGDETGVTYVQATGTAGTSGTELITGYTGITAKTDLFSYTSAAPKTVDATTISGNPAYGKAIAVQMSVANTATQGDLTDETITWIYDEI